MKFDLNLTILIIILLLNVWSIFVKNTGGETVEGFIGKGYWKTLGNMIKEIHSKTETEKYRNVTKASMPIRTTFQRLVKVDFSPDRSSGVTKLLGVYCMIVL